MGTPRDETLGPAEGLKDFFYVTDKDISQDLKNYCEKFPPKNEE
jgi:hypothetical protein